MNSTQLLTLAAQYGIVIDKEHFVQKWHQRFGDSVQFARATFEAYDDNKDDKLSVLEIENIRLHALARAGKLKHPLLSPTIEICVKCDRVKTNEYYN